MKLKLYDGEPCLNKEKLIKVKCLQYLSSNISKYCGFHSLALSSDVFSGILILVYQYEYPNFGTQKNKKAVTGYSIVYNFFFKRLIVLFLTSR